MRLSRSVHLGYEVGSGEPVEIPVSHMVVTGQTQQSGKTTTLDALIQRASLPAIAFLTKRGEGSLSGRRIAPYFRERADWQFVQSILESTMQEKMKFERAWIVRACQGARTLADVQRNVQKLADKARSGLSQDIYMLLGEYLQRVVPLISSLPKTDHIHVGARAGLAVMGLADYPIELQMLVIASTLEWIHAHAEGVITVIPEAWKFIPQGRNTPVKKVAEHLAREGAGLKNFIWIDSQDIAGVEKQLLRGCSVWLIGVQREANEIKRSLDNMPEGMKKPKAGAVATLELGQFFACYGSAIRKVYVQPVWMEPHHAKAVAQGKMSPYELARVKPEIQRAADEYALKLKEPVYMSRDEVESELAQRAQREEDVMYKEQAERLAGQVETLTEELNALRTENAELRRMNIPPLPGKPAAREVPADNGNNGNQPAMPPANVHPLAPFLEPIPAGAVSTIVARVMEEIRRDPVLIRLAVEKPAIEVTIVKKVLPLDESSIKGKVARLMAGGFWNNRAARSFADVKQELIRRGTDPKTPNLRIAEPLHEFTKLGFFFKEGDSYILAPDLQVSEVTA